MIGTGSSLLKPDHPKTRPLQGNEEPFEQQPAVTLMEDGSQRTEVTIPKKHHLNMTAFSPQKQPFPAAPSYFCQYHHPPPPVPKSFRFIVALIGFPVDLDLHLSPLRSAMMAEMSVIRDGITSNSADLTE